ncbi:MAG: leucyl aminopeptidase family protein, partial [Candidatus Obscuribacterales bacterium]|nr:leucyl aminopeptidase family protein [Candidatus Obscuribacterales bacterium]
IKHYKTKAGGHKPEVPLATLRVLTEAFEQETVRKGMFAGRSIGYGVNLARDLVTTPAGELTPMRLMDVSKGIVARSQGLVKGTYYWGSRLKELGANLLMAVGQGSGNPPVLIELDYTPPSGPTKNVLCLIGKSVTFDSGGLDLKPAAGMREMKRDMSGGATVLGALQAIIDLKLPISVKVIMAATENMTGSHAYKPGDVLKSMNGLTVEVDNTDAEGRLTLADAIEYAKRRNVTHIVDFATLTGAVVSIGGDVASACFGNNAQFTRTVRDVAVSQGEKMIEMEMYQELRSLIDSDIADLKNSGGPLAGSTTAALFLSEFAGKDIPWVHVDIAGVAFRSRELEGLPKGATGYGVRTAVALAAELARNS